jgi:hypothetical protein
VTARTDPQRAIVGRTGGLACDIAALTEGNSTSSLSRSSRHSRFPKK